MNSWGGLKSVTLGNEEDARPAWSSVIRMLQIELPPDALPGVK